MSYSYNILAFICWGETPVTAIKIMLNNIELKSNYYLKDIERHLTDKNCTMTMVSLQLIVSMFGFDLLWDESMEGFILKRGKKEVKLEKDRYLINNKEVIYTNNFAETSYNQVPLKVLTQAFGIKGEWLNDETINIIDPVTLPYYIIFNEIHPIDAINQVYLFDLDLDGKDEMYIAYNDESLNLAAFNLQGEWLYDQYLKGISISEMETLNMGKKRILVVISSCGVHTTTINFFSLDTNRLINITTFDSPGSGRVVGDEIHIIYRFYDTADHGIKIVYGWIENLNKFVEIRQEIFYWFDYNRVDLQNAESVVYGFCDAIALGLEEEALSYCSPDIRFAFGKEGLRYSVKHFTINIRRIIDNFRRYSSPNEKILHVQEQSSSDDKKLFIAYYSEIGLQVKKRFQVYRLVLQRVGEEWRILDINFLQNQLPTEIKFDAELNFKAVYPIFSLFTCFSLDTDYLINVKLSVRYPNDKLAHECFIDRCSTVELVELFPGVQISFFREDLRLCYFTFEDAEEVIIDKLDNNISITVSLIVGEEISETAIQ